MVVVVLVGLEMVVGRLEMVVGDLEVVAVVFAAEIDYMT